MEGERMKILMTTDTVGGVWVYSLELCRALQEFDVEVHLAAMGAWPSEIQEQEARALPNVTLYKSDFKLEWMQDPWEDVEKARKWINCIYHTLQPDLVHLNNYAKIGRDWSCPTITVFHSCVQTWWQAVKGTTAPSVWNEYKELVKNSLNASDVIVSPTKAILTRAKNIHGFDTETRVINNGRRDFSSEETPKEDFILCIGRIWDEAKNLRLLSHIAENLPWPVYVAGDLRNPGSGERTDVENLRFLGKLEAHEVREWMEKAAIFVSPTKYEPFGLAILEAAKAGSALVLSNLETLQELWEGAATFFDPENEAEAQEQILKLINDSSIREEMSKKAKKRSKQYSAQKMGNEYFRLYRETIKQKPKTNTASL